MKFFEGDHEGWLRIVAMALGLFALVVLTSSCHNVVTRYLDHLDKAAQAAQCACVSGTKADEKVTNETDAGAP